MRFSTVYIKPDFNAQEWKVYFKDLPHERYNENLSPNALGFYHYPRKIGKEAAFYMLKDFLIREHLARIEACKQSLADLRKVKFPK